VNSFCLAVCCAADYCKLQQCGSGSLCEKATCDPLTGSCEVVQFANGAACGNTTHNGTCKAGACGELQQAKLFKRATPDAPCAVRSDEHMYMHAVPCTKHRLGVRTAVLCMPGLCGNAEGYDKFRYEPQGPYVLTAAVLAENCLPDCACRIVCKKQTYSTYLGIILGKV
jgi:hypothetical protein